MRERASFDRDMVRKIPAALFHPRKDLCFCRRAVRTGDYLSLSARNLFFARAYDALNLFLAISQRVLQSRGVSGARAS